MRKQIITILFTLLTLTVNGLANALPINGQTTAEISDRFPVLFVPAGYVFAIWGLIYIGLLAYSVYQALPAQRENATLQRIAPLYWLASAANAIWILLWHYEYFSWTIVAMATLLLSLIAIYRILRVSPHAGERNFAWAAQLPFSVYLGWISVATIANTAQLLYFLDWNRWGISDVNWTLIMLAVSALLGLAMLLRERDYAYAAVLIWALLGIAAKQAPVAAPVGIGAYVVAGLLFLGMALALVRQARASA
jgi:hypothetical protein